MMRLLGNEPVVPVEGRGQNASETMSDDARVNHRCGPGVGASPLTSSIYAKRSRCQLGADAGDVRQERWRRGVHVHAHAVHDALDHAGRCCGELSLVDVVLVQADAERLGVDLYQLGQRVE
jgi:hypothetical protein